MLRLARAGTSVPLLALASSLSCGGALSSRAADPAAHSLRDANLRAPDDATVHGARTLPLALDAGRSWGASPGGGIRSIVAGERVVSWPDGSLAVAPDRLPGTPTLVTDLPERLGGGLLYVLGARVWRSASWLAPAEPVLATGTPATAMFVGLDRVYLRVQQGPLVAFDPVKKAVVGLGPLPAAPSIGRVAALDAWRAVATADLRGVLFTLDAGSTWRALDVPLEPADVLAVGDRLLVGGVDASRTPSWWEVRADGQVGHLGVTPGARDDGRRDDTAPPATHGLGARPLLAAIEDGWPLTDGTALVARDGTLSRVRIEDGAVVESVPDAYPLRPSRCHPFSLAREGDAGAVGFACGEARGRTRVYRFDGKAGRMVEMRRFDGPREVLPSGSGGLAVRGPCAEDAPGDGAEGEVAYCVLPPGGAWSEIHFDGDDVDRARVVVLGDGRVALVRPPRDADLSTARLSVTDGTKSTHVPLAMPAMPAGVTQALRRGIWRDGFEERRPGVLGGWVDSAGSVVGIEIAVGGGASVGELRSASSDVFVSGRYGLGWTASRRGTETTDGGMTWEEMEMPALLQTARQVSERACGPVGCVAAGWMRVGWGAPPKTKEVEPTARLGVVSRGAPDLSLHCDALSGKAPERAPPPPVRRAPVTLRPPPSRPGPGWGGSIVMLSGPQGSPDLGPFLGHNGPPLHDDESGFTVEVNGGPPSMYPGMPAARIDAWGPRTGDWDQLGRWRIDWVGPYGGWTLARSTAIAQAPWTGLDAARRALQPNGGGVGQWSLAGADDDDHALLVGRHMSGMATTEILELETDRAPVSVHRGGGELLPEVEGAIRVGARWYVATAQPAGELAATVVWLLDGTAAREVARLPRVPLDSRPPLRLARRADGRAVGVVVDGEGVGERSGATRWVSAVDLETGAVGEPEPLAPVEMSDRAVSLCTGDDTGWELDLPYPGRIIVGTSVGNHLTLQQPIARVRLSSQRVCVERIAGALPSLAADHPWLRVRPLSGSGAAPRGETRTLDVAVTAQRSRYSLRCTRM